MTTQQRKRCDACEARIAFHNGKRWGVCPSEECTCDNRAGGRVNMPSLPPYDEQAAQEKRRQLNGWRSDPVAHDDDDAYGLLGPCTRALEDAPCD